MLLSWGDSRPWSFPKGEQCLLRLCPEGGGGGGGCFKTIVQEVSI